MKQALSSGWLYLMLFVLVLLLMLMVVVPEEYLPRFAQKMVTKLGIKELATSGNQECTKLSEEECIANLDRGCVPGYDVQGSTFLDCRTCRKGMSCISFAHPVACANNQCAYDCRWTVGEYRDGYTLKGRCVENEELMSLKRELKDIGFDAGTIQFGRGLQLTRTASGNCTRYTAENDTLVIDHSRSIIGVTMHGEVPAAYDRSGTPVTITTVCGGMLI